MCGIFGELGHRLVDKKSFNDLNDLAYRRGPDSSGYWSDGKYCQLGFRRLAILDLSMAGNQPMISKDGKWVMVYNGEVYNYKEIQNELGLQSLDLRSKSDSEIILHAFALWGVTTAAKKLNGIFAIALYNTENSKLFLIRDFAGVKPLYFGLSDQKIVFGSQYNQIFKHPDLKTKLHINEHSLADFMRLGYIPAPNAMFNNTFQVEPGQICEIDLNFKIKSHFFYKYSPFTGSIKENDDNTISKLDNILYDVIKDQLVSDVNVGTLLSGGIDSPIINYYAKSVKPDIKAFTIENTDKHYDESIFASAYANEFKIEHLKFIYSEETLLNDVDEHFSAYSEPFGGSSSLPTFEICKRIKEHFTVALGGDGADEIFWGYPRFRFVYSHKNLYYIPKILLQFNNKFLNKISPSVPLGIINTKNIGEWYLNNFQSYTKSDILRAIMPEFSHSEKVATLYQLESPRINNKILPDLLNWLRIVEYYGHLQREMIKTDRASMYHSLELRVPYLDKRVIDFSTTILPDKSDDTKIILKKLLSKKIKNNVINHKKYGFAIPLGRFIENKKIYDELCSFSENSYFFSYFNIKEIKKIINNYSDLPLNSKLSISSFLWTFYSLHKWWQIHVR